MTTPTFNWARPASLEVWGAAIRRQRESLDLTLDDVAAKTRISKPYLSNIETARAPGPASEEKLRRLAKALKLPIPTLLAGADFLRAPESIRKLLAAKERPRRPDGTVDLDRLVPPKSRNAGILPATGNASSTDPNATATDPLPLHAVPLINRVAAGKAAEFTDLSYPAGVADQYVQVPDLPDAPAGTAFALRVLGDSMTPDYREGELIVVGPGDPRDGDDCVIRLAEGENFATTFKRIFFIRDEKGEATAVRLVPLNRAHPERQVALPEISGIYPLLYRLVPRRTPKPATVKPSERIKA